MTFVDQGEDVHLPAQTSEGADAHPVPSDPTARSADRENAAGGPVVGPAAVPGDAVTLTRPLCVDGELYAGEWETLTARRDQVIGL